jgi:hypothetical protein
VGTCPRCRSGGVRLSSVQWRRWWCGGGVVACPRCWFGGFGSVQWWWCGGGVVVQGRVLGASPGVQFGAVVVVVVVWLCVGACPRCWSGGFGSVPFPELLNGTADSTKPSKTCHFHVPYAPQNNLPPPPTPPPYRPKNQPFVFEFVFVFMLGIVVVVVIICCYWCWGIFIVVAIVNPPPPPRHTTVYQVMENKTPENIGPKCLPVFVSSYDRLAIVLS